MATTIKTALASLTATTKRLFGASAVEPAMEEPGRELHKLLELSAQLERKFSSSPGMLYQPFSSASLSAKSAPVKPAAITPQVAAIATPKASAPAPTSNATFQKYARKQMSRAAFAALTPDKQSEFCCKLGGKIVDKIESGVEFKFPAPETLTRAEFSQLPPEGQSEFFKSGGKLT